MKCLCSVLWCLTLNLAYCQTPKVIQDHFSALKKHDIEAISRGYAADAVVYSPNWEGAKIGATGVAEVYSRYFSSTPDLSCALTHVVSAGEQVVVEYTVKGTLANPEGATSAYMKGKTYTLNYCAVFLLKNGKIVKESDYFDQVAFLRQVGFFDQK